MGTIFLIRSVSQNYGGIENQILQIAQGIAEKGILEPILVTTSKNNTFTNAFTLRGLPVEVSPHLILSNKLGYNELTCLVKKYKPLILQSHSFRESVITRFVRRTNKSVSHIARIHTYIDCSWIPNWKKKLYHILEMSTQMGVDHYLPINKFAADELNKRSKINRNKITIVHDCVPTIGEFENDLKIESPLKIAMVANMVEHKGHDVLLRGVCELKRRGKIVKVRLIGEEESNSGRVDKPFTKKLKQMALDLGIFNQIEFYGYSNNIYEAICDAPVIVLPSDSEGTPNCLLEGMSVGKIVVGTNVGGVPELITNEVNGFIHEKQDHIGFANSIEKIAEKNVSEIDNIRRNGYKTWLEKYSVNATIENLHLAYQRYI
ncbi:MAG: glycosyltransferase family 4 protein [Candidatus Thermoplasmatota archaeon]|nr:glycosyltransferase family 4 protein [Candidatus Thermoplasmatota archaeon]